MSNRVSNNILNIDQLDANSNVSTIFEIGSSPSSIHNNNNNNNNNDNNGNENNNTPNTLVDTTIVPQLSARPLIDANLSYSSSSSSSSYSSSSNLPTLQGYLLKHASSFSSSSSSSPSLSFLSGGAGGGGGFRKKRWFVCAPNTGKLYYYRTREDLFALGEIDIRSASIVILKSANTAIITTTTNTTKSFSNSFVFEIVSGPRSITLEAASTSDGFYWIKNLQIIRQYLCNSYLGNDTKEPNLPSESGESKSPDTKITDFFFYNNSNNNNNPSNTTIRSPKILFPNFNSFIDYSSSPSPQSQSIFYCDSNSNISAAAADKGAYRRNGETIIGQDKKSNILNNNNNQNNNQNNIDANKTAAPNEGNRSINAMLDDFDVRATSSSSSSSLLSLSLSSPPSQSSASSSPLLPLGSSASGVKVTNPLQQQPKTKIFSAIRNRITPVSASVDGKMDSTACGRCKKLEEQLITINHDRFALEDEMKTNREVIKILQEQLRIFNSEKAAFEATETSTGSGGGREPDYGTLSNEIMHLKIQCKCLQKDNENLAAENRALTDSKSVLEEMLESRDRTLVSLTHEVYDLESKNSRMATRAELERELLQDEMPRKVQQRIEQLKDTVIAFEQQNEFLNKEIIELNDIRHRMELKEKRSQARLCEVEAKCSQIQSKLLSLLKELNQCIGDEQRRESDVFHNRSSETSEQIESSSKRFVTNDAVRALVARLLEESSLDIPLSWKPGNKPRNWSSGAIIAAPASSAADHYDELGFYHRAATNSGDDDDDTSGGTGGGAVYDLMLESNDSMANCGDAISANAIRSWRTKWDHFMSNLSNVSAASSVPSDGGGGIAAAIPVHRNSGTLLKQMLRLGVPQDYRCKIWRMLIQQRVKQRRARYGDDYYESLLRANRSTASNLGTATGTKVIDPSAKQIELDLLRTLPNNKHFEKLESDGVSRLRRVLLAYSLHNRAVGYCQGLNRLAAVALLFMPEEDTFWCLVAIVETIMPEDYFGKNLMGAHVDQYVLRDLIAEKLPTLSQHMEQNRIEISLFAWFLTVFVDNIPVAVYLHIWDVFLYEGSKVLFRFALAILKMHENELLRLSDSAAFNQFLRTLDERQFDLRRLSVIAFRELNPFSSSRVRAKRAHYTALVTDELRKIEQIRDAISVQQHQRRRDHEQVKNIGGEDEHHRTKEVEDEEDDNDNSSDNAKFDATRPPPQSSSSQPKSPAPAQQMQSSSLITFDDDNDSD